MLFGDHLQVHFPVLHKTIQLQRFLKWIESALCNMSESTLCINPSGFSLGHLCSLFLPFFVTPHTIPRIHWGGDQFYLRILNTRIGSSVWSVERLWILCYILHSSSVPSITIPLQKLFWRDYEMRKQRERMTSFHVHPSSLPAPSLHGCLSTQVPLPQESAFKELEETGGGRGVWQKLVPGSSL